MHRPSKRLRLLRAAAASPRQARLNFAVRPNDMEPEDAEIPLGQPSPITSEEVAGPPCDGEPLTLSQNDAHDNVTAAVDATPPRAPKEAEKRDTDKPPPCYWATEPPTLDIRLYRGAENNAARLGQEYNLVVQLLVETWVLPHISVPTRDEVEENTIIAKRYLEDISFFLRGWHPHSDFDDEGVVRKMLNRALKMRTICKHALREDI